MAQRTLFPAFVIWSLIPGEDYNVFAQCRSIRFLQSGNQKHNGIIVVVFEIFPHTPFFQTYMITKVFPKLHEKFGRLFVHCLNHFRKLKKTNSHLVTFRERTFGFKKKKMFLASKHELMKEDDVHR